MFLPRFKPQTVKSLAQSLYSLCYYRKYKCKGKGNVHPRTGHASPQGGGGLHLLFLTTALYGVGGQGHAPAALPLGKVKVKFALIQALRLGTGRTAHRGSRGIALTFFDHGTRRG